MVEEMSKIIIDENLVLDVNTGLIGPDKHTKNANNMIATEELFKKIDRVEEAITDLESSLDPNSVSRISKPGREGIYANAGFLTNMVLGIIIALVFIILLI